MIGVGDRLPAAELLQKTEDGPVKVDLGERLTGRKVILFAVPGAYTPTCSSAHLPSFMRTAAAFRDKGVDEIICISVNDIHVMKLWGEETGATAAGITLLADPAASFTKAIGMNYSVPEVGFYDRSRRYAMLVEDGVVKVLNLDEIGTCAISTGEELLDALG